MLTSENIPLLKLSNNSLEERCHPHQEGREHGGQRASNPCWRERRSYHNLNLPYLVY